jgi:hypothetical protein
LATGLQGQNIVLANNASLTTLAATKKFGLIKAEQELLAVQKLATAQVGLFARGVGLLGGPLGVAITAVVLFSDELGNLLEQVTGLTPEIEKLAKARELQTKLREAGVSSKDSFADEKLKLVELQEELERTLEKRFRLEDAIKNGRLQQGSLKELIQDFKILGAGGIANAQDAIKGFDAEIQKTQKSIDDLTKKIEGNKFVDVETPAVDSNFLANLQAQIELFKRVIPLLKQGVELDDATFIAKSKIANINDTVTVSYLNFKNQQEEVIKRFQAEKKILDELNKIRNEEIPLLKLSSSLIAQGVELSDAETIAKLKLKGVSDELIVTYLNTVNSQKELIKTQKELNDKQDEAKKLNEQALDPLEKLAKTFESLKTLQANGLNQDAFNKGIKDAVTDYESATSGALQYADVIQTLNDLYEDGTRAGFDVKNVNLELAISYQDLITQFREGKISQDEFVRSSQDLLRTTDEQAKRIDKLSKILNETNSAKLEEQREQIRLLYEEYALGTNEALNSIEELGEAVDVVLGRQDVKVEESADFLQAAFKRAAENAQDAFADFLFDPFKDGLDGMLLNFLMYFIFR